ncbi:hypothetical protein [Vagococcus salmoninarum]|uniref:hypothetical protein n=1 Tax=Vagococcus salmoninarum TaxID=2739 RepID=UPI003F98D058
MSKELTITQKLSQAFAESQERLAISDAEKQAETKLIESYPLEYVQQFKESGSKVFTKGEVLASLRALQHAYQINADKTKLDSYVTAYQEKQHTDFVSGASIFAGAIEELTGKPFEPQIVSYAFRGGL